MNGKGIKVRGEQTNDENIQQNTTPIRILSAAQACFEIKGIQKTSIDDIANRCGVSRPTIYRYFPGKQAMIEAIALREMIAIGRLIRARVPHQGTFAEKLTEALFISVELGRTNSYVQIIINDPAMMNRCFDRGGIFTAGNKSSGNLSYPREGEAVTWQQM